MTEPITASKLRELADVLYCADQPTSSASQQSAYALRAAADQMDALSAKHKRAVTTLRNRPIGGVTYYRIGAGPTGIIACETCGGKGDEAEFGKGKERHLPVTINGVTGKCPCDLREGENG